MEEKKIWKLPIVSPTSSSSSPLCKLLQVTESSSFLSQETFNLKTCKIFFTRRFLLKESLSFMDLQLGKFKSHELLNFVSYYYTCLSQSR